MKLIVIAIYRVLKNIIPKILLFIISFEISLNLTHFAIQAYRVFLNKSTSPNEFKILTIGESTSDKLAHAPGKKAWPEQLEEILNNDPSLKTRFTIINKARTSVNSSYHAQRISSYIKEHRPQLIISMLGINDATPFYINHFDSHWYAHFRLVKLFKWFQQPAWMNNTDPSLRIFRVETFFTNSIKNFLAEKQNHTNEKIFKFISNLQTQYPEIDPWQVEDTLANLFVEIGYYSPINKTFERHNHLQINKPIFYHNIAFQFFRSLLKRKKVGFFSPHTIPWLLKSYPQNKTIKEYALFLISRNNEKLNPATRTANNEIMKMFNLPVTDQKSRPSLIETLQRNYLSIISEAKKNGITIYPIQYPRLPSSWLRTIIEGNKITSDERQWFCADYISVTSPAQKINQDIIIISNEDIKIRCQPSDQNCFRDNFHNCLNNQDYTFGHAGPILDQMIAINTYKTIKKNWKSLRKTHD